MNHRRIRIHVPLYLCLTIAGHACASSVEINTDCMQQAYPGGVARVDVEPPRMVPEVQRVPIAVLTQWNSGRNLRTGERVLGHTTTHWTISHATVMWAYDPGQAESTCYQPVVHVKLGMTPIQVFVGSEVQAGCALDYVLAHEKEHVRLYLAGLPAAGQAIRTALIARYRDLRVMASTPVEVQMALEIIESDVEDIIVRHVEAQESAHKQFDAKEQADMAQHPCRAPLRGAALHVAAR